MKTLKIQDYLRANGLAKTIQNFSLKCKVYENKIALKYDMLESPMSSIEVQEARSLILDKTNYNVLCLTFTKFFNFGESLAAKIDWSSARCFNKLDGSLIQVYYDPYAKIWQAATSGSAEGEGAVNDVTGTRFNVLFWDTLLKVYGVDSSIFKIGYCYAFELTTPYNIVVTPHGNSSASLLAIRNLETLEELPYDEVEAFAKSSGLKMVDSFSFSELTLDTLLSTFDNMPWTEEGYIVVDKYFNRIKVKNPAYVAVHHLKDSTAYYRIIDVIKTNEIDEFIAVFPSRKDEIIELQKKYNDLINRLDECWKELQLILPKDDTKEESKRFALALFDTLIKYNLKQFSSLYFTLSKNRSMTIREYMKDFDSKRLYSIVNQ